LKALISGATGLVGRELLKRLQGPVVLTRAPAEAAKKLGSDVTAWAWRPEAEEPPGEAFAGVDTVFHLAGEPVAEGRWNAEKKQRIRASRVLGTRQLVAALARLAAPPRVLVSASAVGYYGDRGDAELDERSAPGQGFLAEVCQEWEHEARVAESHGIRVVCARLGIVLAARGGALARMLPPFRMGVGGQLGDGRQWMPWVHVDDVVGLLLHAAQADALRGALNVVSPTPVSNAEFTRQLGRALQRPTLLSVPRLALRVAFGELSQALLASQRVLPKAAEQSGYRFVYPELSRALESCIHAGAEGP
jgi:uncharacterized protein (TIGR01777 family)